MDSPGNASKTARAINLRPEHSAQASAILLGKEANTKKECLSQQNPLATYICEWRRLRRSSEGEAAASRTAFKIFGLRSRNY
jgi:hypothetical protein